MVWHIVIQATFRTELTAMKTVINQMASLIRCRRRIPDHLSSPSLSSYNAKRDSMSGVGRLALPV